MPAGRRRRWARSFAAALAAIAAVVATAGWLTTPSHPNAAGIAAPIPPADVDAWLASSESAANESSRLVAGTEKRVVWREPGRRTRHAVVYLHGFSASRAEIAPAAERIAAALDANLFETRLAGHGLRHGGLDGVRAEDWLADAIEALAVGRAIGDRLVVIGNSTGATLALALAGHPALDDAAALILLSPNLGPRDASAEWLLRPFGPLIAPLVAGRTRSWSPHNAAQGRYWTTSYPIEAVVEMMRVVALARSKLPATLEADVLFVVSPEDTVVSTSAARDAFDAIDAPHKQFVEFAGSADPSRHILAGDVLSPGTTDRLVDLAVRFAGPVERQADRE